MVYLATPPFLWIIAARSSIENHLSYLTQGILYGLVLMLSTGPSFFYLIKVGIEKGFRRALSFALGIFISDVLLLSLIFVGLQPLFENDIFKQAFSLSSGILIVIFGMSMLVRKRPEEGTTKNVVVKDQPLYRFIIQGFGVNLLNPFTSVMWVGVLGTVSPSSRSEFVQFIIGVLGVIFLADGTKAILAKMIGKLLTPMAVFRLNKFLGIAFIIIGAYFIYLFYDSFVGGNSIQMEVPGLE